MSDRFYLLPIVKNVGGKSWFREEAFSHYYNSCRARGIDMRWVDPFCGGLAVPLYILPNRAWMNDLNIYLVNFYNHIIKHGKMKDFSNDLNEETYYQMRSKFNENIKNGVVDGEEMAEIYYYLNKTCYGGLNRYNDSGFFNAPYGKNNPVSMKTDFPIYQEVLADWKFTSLNYEDVLNNVNEDDFLFVDPPYHLTFNKYIKRAFNWDDQVRLVEILSKLSNPIVATNSYNDDTINLYTSHGFSLKHRWRKNYLQQGRAEKVKSEKFKEAIFIKNVFIDEH